MDTQIISAATALAAVVIGPLVSVYITKKQIRADVVSTNRQQWINSLRDQISIFIRDVRFLAIAYSVNAIEPREAWDRYEEMVLTLERLQLMLNPNEAEHVELLRLVSSAKELVLDSMKSKESDGIELHRAADRIIPLSQQILKSEWVRVKNGE